MSSPHMSNNNPIPKVWASARTRHCGGNPRSCVHADSVNPLAAVWIYQCPTTPRETRNMIRLLPRESLKATLGFILRLFRVLNVPDCPSYIMASLLPHVAICSCFIFHFISMACVSCVYWCCGFTSIYAGKTRT